MIREEIPANVARVVLLKWVRDNPRAPIQWRAVAERIATHRDMLPAWKELAKHGVEPMVLFSFVNKAIDNADKETRRQSATEERRGVERVARLARDLKIAIEESPLPRNSAKLAQLGDGEKSVPLLFGWREIEGVAKFLKSRHALTVCEVLELAEKMAQEHLRSLPPRSTSRHRGKGVRPLQVAFVRWLAWQLGSELGNEFRGVIARVSTAIFDESPLTKRDVDVILKDRPSPFVPPKKRVQNLR